MNLYKRIMLSIFRRPIKNGLLFILIFMLGTFSGSSYLISKCINNVEIAMKSNIDTYAVIKYKDYDHYLNELNNYEFKESQSNLLYIYDELSLENYISKNNINFATECNHDGTFKSNISLPNKNSFYDYLSNSVSLLGIDEDTIVFDDLFKITDGNTNVIDEIIENDYAVAINEDYRYDDGTEIKIGDKINIEYRNYEVDFGNEDLIFNTKNNIKYELTVVAKYETSNSNNEKYDIMYSQTSPLIISNSSLTQISKETEKSDISKNLVHDYTNYIYTNIIFKLDSVDSLNNFQDRYMELTKNMPYFEMITTADGYFEIKEILDNMNFVSKTILIISSISAVLIGMLIIYLYIKDRKLEIGLLTVLGEKRQTIITQIICEIGLITLLGLSCSIFSSIAVGNAISANLVANQVESFENTYNEEIKENFEVNITKEYIFIMYSLGMLVMSISCVLPSKILLKSNPKDNLI